MNELLKSIFIVSISVALSMQWCHSHFDKRLPPARTDSPTPKNIPSSKMMTVTNYLTITNYVTVTNIVESVPAEKKSILSPGIPLQQDTQSVSSVDIQPPIENETRLRKIAKELTDILDEVKIKK